MKELKPCPFCGSSDIDDSYSVGTRSNDHTAILYGAGCNNCGCQTEMYETTSLAIKAWNTRNTITIDEAVEALRKEIDWLSEDDYKYFEQALRKLGV